MARTNNFSKSPRSAKPNFIYINHCRACDSKWDSFEVEFECPKCYYEEPRILDDPKLKIITRRKYAIDANNRIKCHVVSDQDQQEVN